MARLAVEDVQGHYQEMRDGPGIEGVGEQTLGGGGRESRRTGHTPLSLLQEVN